ncbi:MAG TPA: O-antigen ligase family protein [Patescibacteria group bacterium]|nr:O-antigen ligase family protein [Patescibacteria group bacterium]
MNKKTYQWILKVGSALAFVVIFLLFNKLFFPYVASKQLSFNILIEILLAFYLVYIIKYKEERPSLRLMSWSLVAFFSAMLLSVVVSTDAYLSFWGKTERMLGFFNVVHFLAFYFILISAFKKAKEWKYLLTGLMLSGFVISLAMLLGNNPQAVLGNRAYTAGFLIFAFYISIYLFLQTKPFWRYLYLVPILTILPAFIKADITGAVIALGSSLMLFLLLIAIFYRRKWYRLGALVLSLVIIVTTVLALIYPENSFVKNNKILSQISWQENTFQTRLIAWEGALESYKQYPVLGTGYNTFSYTFDKHFKADFYNHTRTETYFDRAHNNLLDIASTMGTVGLISYLMIMLSALIYIIKVAFRQKKKSDEDSGENNSYLYSDNLLAQIILLALLTAYFVQNLAVFDSFVTYLALMIFLAYLRFLYVNSFKLKEGKERNENKAEIKGVLKKGSEKKKKAIVVSGNFEYLLLFVFLLASLYLVFSVNVSTLKAHSRAVMGYGALYQGQVEIGIKEFKNAMEKDIPWQRDPRSSFIKLVLNNSQVFSGLSNEKKLEFYNELLLINAYNLNSSNESSIYNLQEAQIFQNMASLAKRLENDEKKDLYNEKALQYINKAIELSPERIKQYYLKGQLLIDLGQVEKGLEQWEIAINLNPEFNETYCQYAQAYMVVKKDDLAYEQMDKCVDSGAVRSFGQSQVLARATKHYQEKGDIDRMLAVYSRYAQIVNQADIWQSVAELYTQVENWQKAKNSAQKAYQLSDDFKQRGSLELLLEIIEKKLDE